MDRIEPELFGLDRPSFADELVGCQTFEGLEATTEVVGADKVGEMPFELFMVVVVVALDGGVLDRAVHSFHLTVCPRVLRFGCAMVDAGLGAREFEGVGTEQFSIR